MMNIMSADRMVLGVQPNALALPWRADLGAPALKASHLPARQASSSSTNLRGRASVLASRWLGGVGWAVRSRVRLQFPSVATFVRTRPAATKPDRARKASLAFSALLVLAGACPAGDWPTLLGPTFDMHSTETNLLRAFPADGLRLVWSVPKGDGYAAPAIANGKVILFHRLGDSATVDCLDARDGHQLWRFAAPTAYRDRYGYNHGPRCSPVIAGDAVIAYGADGQLHCLELETGKLRWRHDVLKEFKLKQNFFGVGSTPLVLEDKVIVNVGAPEAAVVAFDLRSGKTIWKTDRGIDWASDKFGAASDPDQRKAYSTPFVWKRKGRDELVTAGARCFASYDPATGKELWRIPHGGFSNATRPLVAGNRLLLNTGFNRPEFWALRADHDRAPAESDIVWKIARGVPTMSSPLVHNGLLYFTADADFLTCVDLENGQEVWKERLGGRFYASLMMAGGALYAISDRGRSVVLEPGRAFRTLGEGVLPEGSRSSPAVARGRLYLRTYDALVCIGNT